MPKTVKVPAGRLPKMVDFEFSQGQEELLANLAGREPIYRRAISDLRAIGHDEVAAALESEADLLYGKPGGGVSRWAAELISTVSVVPLLPDDDEPFLPPAYPGAIDP